MHTNRRIDFPKLRELTPPYTPTVLTFYGLTPIGSGDQVRITCPFHAGGQEKHPSCSFNLRTGLWKCHATGCPGGEGGNLVDFVWRMETRDGATVSVRQAGHKLAAICGIEAPTIARGNGPGNGAQTRQEGRSAGVAAKTGETSSPGANVSSGRPQRESEAVPARAATEKAEIRNKPLGFRLTLDLDAALPYLEGRGVSREVATEFGLGLCTSGKTIVGRLAIPIHNPHSEIVAYAGRWIGSDDDIPEDQGKYQLPKNFHKQAELFNVHRVTDCQTLTIVEGFFGAIRLFGSLRPRIPAVALMGASISEQQIALLKEHCPTLRFITLCLDGNEPGRKASELVAAQLARHWWVRIATLPDGMQPDTAPQADLLTALGRTR